MPVTPFGQLDLSSIKFSIPSRVGKRLKSYATINTDLVFIQSPLSEFTMNETADRGVLRAQDKFVDFVRSVEAKVLDTLTEQPKFFFREKSFDRKAIESCFKSSLLVEGLVVDVVKSPWVRNQYDQPSNLASLQEEDKIVALLQLESISFGRRDFHIVWSLQQAKVYKTRSLDSWSIYSGGEDLSDEEEEATAVAVPEEDVVAPKEESGIEVTLVGLENEA